MMLYVPANFILFRENDGRPSRRWWSLFFVRDYPTLFSCTALSGYIIESNAPLDAVQVVSEVHGRLYCRLKVMAVGYIVRHWFPTWW